jgi:hypothetical protein
MRLLSTDHHYFSYTNNKTNTVNTPMKKKTNGYTKTATAFDPLGWAKALLFIAAIGVLISLTSCKHSTGIYDYDPEYKNRKDLKKATVRKLASGRQELNTVYVDTMYAVGDTIQWWGGDFYIITKD